MKRFLDMSRVMAVMLAGGYGNRLYPLTRRTPKPGVSLGASHRLLDFNLSNLFNSAIFRIYTTVQYGSAVVVSHLLGLQDCVSPRFNQGLLALPPGDVGLFESDADSLVQNAARFNFSNTDYVVLCAADQITNVDFRPLLHRLMETEAEAAFAYKRVNVEDARGRLGVFELDSDAMILGIEEQPLDPKIIPGTLNDCTSNPYMYAFRVETFQAMIAAIKTRFEAHLNLSRTGLKWLFDENKRIAALDIVDMAVPGSQGLGCGFWVDAGTVDDYFRVQQMFADELPTFDLYNPDWVIHTAMPKYISPAKVNRVTVDGALFGYNAIVQSGSSVVRSVVSSGVNVGNSVTLKDCVILPGSQIGDGADLSGVIVDEETVIPNNFRLHASDLSAESNNVMTPEEARLSFNGKPVTLPLVRTAGGVLVITKDYFSV